MADSLIQLPADGVGKNSRTFLHTVGANSVHSPAVGLINPATGNPFSATGDTLSVIQPDVTSGVVSVTALNVTASIGPVNGIGVVTAYLDSSGNFNGTLLPETSEDGVAWQGVYMTQISTQTGAVRNLSPVTSAIGAGFFNRTSYRFNMSGVKYFRIRCSVYNAGSIAVTVFASVAPNWVGIDPTQNLVQLDGVRSTNAPILSGGSGTINDIAALVLNTDPHKARVSKGDFSMGAFVQVSPVAISPGVYTWRSLQAWQMPNLSPYYWFLARNFNWAITGAATIMRAGEKTLVGTWVSNGTTAGTFTQGGTALTPADVWTDVFFEVTVGPMPSAQTFTLTYVDEGNVVRTGGAASIASAAAVGTRVAHVMSASSIGLSYIQSMACGTALAAGVTIKVWGFKTIAMGASMTGSAGGSVEIEDTVIGYYASNRGNNTFVAIEYTATAITAVNMWGGMSGIFTSVMDIV